MPELHPDAEAFLESRSDAPPMSELPIEQLRQSPPPEGDPDPVRETEDVVVPGDGVSIPIRLYTPRGEPPYPILLWAHGGGSILGSIEGDDAPARALANATECVVASIEYRLAPENPFPAAFYDYLRVLDWADDHGDDHVAHNGQLLVAGASAGGKLAAATAHYVRDHGGPTIDSQVLVYPSVNYSEHFESYDEYDGYMFTLEDIEWLHEQYLDDPIHGYNPYAFPLEDSYFGDLPPTTIVTAEFDPLQGPCYAYAQRLDEAGVAVSHHHYEDMVHAFFGNVMQPEWERAREAMADVGADVTSTLERDSAAT